VVPQGTELEPETIERLRLGIQIMALRALGDPDTAEEAVQETLVRTLEALGDGRLRDPEKLGAFVRGIARHVISETYRARRRSVGLEEVPEEQRETGRDDPLGNLITADELQRVRRAVTLLSVRDRQILHLSFFEGLTPVEIAERLGEPALRIRKRKSRALARLRQVILGTTAGCHESRSSVTQIKEG
jgi:RNA polymerase sigma-70 factor (ECF subfamily)